MTTPPQKDTATVYLGAELRARLDVVAAKERRTLSQLIRLALEDWLNTKEVS